jgi:hypothetical protein
MLQVAEVSSASALDRVGAQDAIWITMLITIGITAIVVAIYLLGGAGLSTPDLQGWLQESRTAFQSPRFGETVRS